MGIRMRCVRTGFIRKGAFERWQQAQCGASSGPRRAIRIAVSFRRREATSRALASRNIAAAIRPPRRSRRFTRDAKGAPAAARKALTRRIYSGLPNHRAEKLEGRGEILRVAALFFAGGKHGSHRQGGGSVSDHPVSRVSPPVPCDPTGLLCGQNVESRTGESIGCPSQRSESSPQVKYFLRDE